MTEPGAQEIWEQYRRARFAMLFGRLDEREEATLEAQELFRSWARARNKEDRVHRSTKNSANPH